MNKRVITVIILFIISFTKSVHIYAADTLVKESGYYEIKTRDSNLNVLILKKSEKILKGSKVSIEDFSFKGDLNTLSNSEIIKNANLKVDNNKKVKVVKHKDACLTGCNPDIVKYTIVVDNGSMPVYGYKDKKNSKKVKVVSSNTSNNNKKNNDNNQLEQIQNQLVGNPKIISLERTSPSNVDDSYSVKTTENKLSYPDNYKVLIGGYTSLIYLLPLVLIGYCFHISKRRLKGLFNALSI